MLRVIMYKNILFYSIKKVFINIYNLMVVLIPNWHMNSSMPMEFIISVGVECCKCELVISGEHYQS